MYRLCGIFFSFFLLYSISAAEEAPSDILSSQECIDCHLRVTPAVVKEFREGAMGRAFRQNRNVPKEINEPSCADCHGTDHTIITKSHGRVPEEVCGNCHLDEFQQHVNGGHTKSRLDTSWSRMLDSRSYFLLPEEIRATSCEPCHSISGATDRKYWDEKNLLYSDRGRLELRNGCDSCHNRHAFSLEKARQPEACMLCHSGGHASDYDAYISSPHGRLYKTDGSFWNFSAPSESSDFPAPTCVTCHMLTLSEGKHQLKHNMAITGEPEFASLCSGCHEKSFAEKAFLNYNSSKKYLEDLLSKNILLNDLITRRRWLDKNKRDASSILWTLQNESMLKGIPFLPELTSGFNMASTGIAHNSHAVTYRGLNKLHQDINGFEQWFSNEKTRNRLNIYTKIALLLGLILLFLIMLLPRKKRYKSSIEL